VSTPEVLPPSRGSAKTIAIVTVVVAFIAGLLIGMVGDRIYLVRHRDRIGMRGARFMTQRIVAHLDSELHLTPQQREEVTRILDARRDRISAINAAVRPQVRREIEDANAEIEKVLTPEQRAAFEKMKIRMLPRRDHDRELAPGSTPPREPLTEPGTPAPTAAGSRVP
jgi:hypothetical protein